MEKGACIMNFSGERDDIALLIQMEAPDELESFRNHLKEHMSKFPRFSSRIVRVGNEFFLRKVTDESVIAS